MTTALQPKGDGFEMSPMVLNANPKTSRHQQIEEQAPSVVGPMLINYSTDGQRAFHSKLKYGYAHRGVEKMCEQMNWVQIPPILERVDYLAPSHIVFPFLLCVEKLAGFSVSQRAKRVREIVLILDRISNHLYYFSNLSRSVEFSFGDQGFLRARERVCDFLEMFSGARQLHGGLCIGGVTYDVSEGFLETLVHGAQELAKMVLDLKSTFLKNFVVEERLRGKGKLSPGIAHSLGISDPRNEGDALDRASFRFLELESALQALVTLSARVPLGDYKVKFDMLNFSLKNGDFAYFWYEGARGRVAVCLESAGNKPWRLKIKPAGLELISAIPTVLEGADVSDLAPILASFDLLPSEVDR